MEQKLVHQGLVEKTNFACHAARNDSSNKGGQKGRSGGSALRPRVGKKQLKAGVNQLPGKEVFLSNGHLLVRCFMDSRRHNGKVHAERSSAEVKATAASEDVTAASQQKEGHFTRPEAPYNSQSSSGKQKQSAKGAIALEAATHFQQFDTVLRVLEVHEKAVKAEVAHSESAQLYKNGTWPVLLGLARGLKSAGDATTYEVQLQEIQSEQSANDASWALEKAEMEAKLEEMSREAANLEALLRDLQQEALTTTQTAGPWQGEEAGAEERAWWPPSRMSTDSASPSASPYSQQLHHTGSHAPGHSYTTRSLAAPQATPAAVAPPIPHLQPPSINAQLRRVEQPPLLAAQESLTRRLSELRTQVAKARGAPRNPLEQLGLRGLETLRECQRGGGAALGTLSERLRGTAVPIVQKSSREAQLVVGAVVFAAAAAVTGGLVRRAYRHHQEVQIVAMRLAAEEQLRKMQGTVVDLNVDNFVPVLTTRPTIVKFYTDWCPYCKRMAPTWEDLAKRVSEKGLNVQVARLNADVYSEPVMDLNLKGFPSLVLFQGTKPILNYTGPRDIDALLGVVEATYGQNP